MDIFVENKLEEWNLSYLKETFEGKVALFNVLTVNFSFLGVIF